MYQLAVNYITERKLISKRSIIQIHRAYNMEGEVHFMGEPTTREGPMSVGDIKTIIYIYCFFRKDNKYINSVKGLNR